MVIILAWSLNLTESKSMQFSRLSGTNLKKFKSNINVKINGISLENVDSYKYLGILLIIN